MQGGAGDTYRAAERIGVRAWGGKADEIRVEDHGRMAGLLRRGGEEASKRGPRVSGRKKRARRGRNCWCAGPGRQGGTRRWLAGLLARSKRGVREERAQERGGAVAGPAGPRAGEESRAREKGLGWVGLGLPVLGLGWVLFSFSILFLKQTNMFEFKYKFEFKPHSLN